MKSGNGIDLMRFAADEEGVYSARMGAGLPVRGFRLIDLFAGAGGLTLGFSKSFGHSFELAWANDFNGAAVETYNSNFGGHCIVGDVNEIIGNKDFQCPSADVVIGGPPCQGFSLLNKNRSEDTRKQLWRPFLKIVALSGADIFVMENVPQLLASEEFREIVEMSLSMGYTPAYYCLKATDYGVPQGRLRAFIIGCRFADPNCVFPPKKTHFDPANPPKNGIWAGASGFVSSPEKWRTVRDAISDLPIPVGTEQRNTPPPLDLHFGRQPTETSMLRYRAVSREGMNRFDLQRLAPHITPGCWIRKTTGGTDLFGRLWWDRPAFTIRTEFFKPEKGRYLHPKQHRPITHREAARLQSFPDNFRFCGSKIEVAKQIGNAVPPLLASRVADSVYSLLALRETIRAGRANESTTKLADVTRANA